MRFNFYDKKVLAPAKLGTRYLNELYEFNAYSDSNKIVLPKGSILTSKVIIESSKCIRKDGPFSKLNLDEVEWIIIRPPMDLMISSIHTELVLYWSGDINSSDKTEKELIDNLTYSDADSFHYQYNLYREMFLKVNPNVEIKFVQLEHLSLFCDKVLNKFKELPPSKYSFNTSPYWISKEDSLEYIKLAYPIHYSQLMKNIVIEEFFYKKIVNSDKLITIDKIENYQ